MKRIIIFGIIIALLLSCSASKDNSDIKNLLVHQLKNTHDNQDWFVPTKIAISGLTSEQSMWKDGNSNHSIAELVSHLVFWNQRILKVFKGETVADFTESNDVTFQLFETKEWEYAVEELDRIQTDWEQLVANATNAQIKEWSLEIANMSAHNAYHTGQIIFIRKQNSWWK